MNLWKVSTVAACVGIALTMASYGTPTMASISTFTGTTEGWTQIGTGTASSDGTHLQDAFAAGPGSQESRLFSTASQWTGSYQALAVNNSLYAVFDFDATTITPSTLALYFHTTGGNEWTYNTTVSSTGFSTYWMPMIYSGNWQENFGPGSGAAFFADLANVDRMGIYLVTDASGNAQSFLLDNFQLGTMLPEPESVGLIMAALLSLGVTFRGRLNSLVATILGLFGRK